jgi:hypothetical protein
MNGQRELAISIGGLLIETDLFQPPGRSSEAASQRGPFIGISQFLEQAPDLLRPLPGGANDA